MGSSKLASKLHSSALGSGTSRLQVSKRQWQKRLGLGGWTITLTRRLPEGVEIEGYAGSQTEPKAQVGMAMVDPHGMKAIIYVAGEEELGEVDLTPEQVLVHEMLHIRLSGLEVVPPTEPAGHTMVLENTIHALTKALLGTKVA